MKTIHELHRDWQDADNAWQDELSKAFGKDAGDRRYEMDKSSHPAACLAAYEQKKMAWRAFNERGGFNALFFAEAQS